MFLTSRERNSRKVLNLNLYDGSKTVYDFHAWKITNCQNVDYTGCSSAVSSDLSFSRNLTRVWSLSEIGLVSDWYPELSDCYPPIRALSTLIRNSVSQSEVKNRDDQFECGHLKITNPMELLMTKTINMIKIHWTFKNTFQDNVLYIMFLLIFWSTFIRGPRTARLFST